MGTRSFADVAPTSATAAMNAAFTGYGGHSLLTPHYAIKQLWWTQERIRGRVTRSFVINRLTGEERDFLHRPLAFGEGLTDQTYLEWILERARRLFLILAEIGLPDQIFGCIDDAWDDDDLPISFDVIPSLELSIEPDPALNKKFYDTQFIYLLRELQPGSHIDYGPKEHIPMEHVNTRPPAVALQIWDRVHFPEKPEDVYMRRKYALTESDTDGESRDSFVRNVKKAQKLSHEHIASVWASYTAENAAYILSDFVGEHTLGTFVEHRMPVSYQRVSAPQRPALLLKWIHCMADALASLHHRGVAHTTIRPSSVLISHENRIAFAEIGSIRTFQRGKKIAVTEMYDYAAPESKLSSPSVFEITPPISKKGAVNKLRKLSSSASGSSGSSSAGASTRTNSIDASATVPATPASTARTSSVTSADIASPLTYSTPSFYSMGKKPARLSVNTSDVPQSPFSATRVFSNLTVLDPGSLRDLPVASPQMSDVFSLACLYLDIVTFMIKGRVDGFVKHRTTRVKSSLANNKTVRVDTSFHYDPEKILSWMAILEGDCKRRSEQIYRGIPQLLQLVQGMLQQNATLRPTALEVRDEVQRILIDLCGLESLCCIDRGWNVRPLSGEPESPHHNDLRDSVTICNGLSMEQSSRIAVEGHRFASVSVDAARSASRADSNAASGGRRGSKSVIPSAKMAPWKRAFSRPS